MRGSFKVLCSDCLGLVGYTSDACSVWMICSSCNMRRVSKG